MTSEQQQSPAAEKHSSEEIVKKVEQIQKEYDIPAISSNEAAEFLDYKDDYVTVKLNELVDDGLLNSYKSGARYIYWVPEEEQSGGEVDVSSVGSNDIDLESIDSEKFSYKKAREIAETHLEEFEDKTWWQHSYKYWYETMQIGGIMFGLGFGIVLTDTQLIEEFSVPQIVFELGAILFVIGGSIITTAAILMIILSLGQKAAEREWLPTNPSFPRPW